MSVDLSETFRELIKTSIKNSQRSFETLMLLSRSAWDLDLPLPDSVRTLRDKIRQTVEANAAAHFALAWNLVESKDAGEALSVYAEHITRLTQAMSRQLQEISSLAVQIPSANGLGLGDDSASVRFKNQDVLSPSVAEASIGGKVPERFLGKEVSGASPPERGLHDQSEDPRGGKKMVIGLESARKAEDRVRENAKPERTGIKPRRHRE